MRFGAFSQCQRIRGMPMLRRSEFAAFTQSFEQELPEGSQQPELRSPGCRRLPGQKALVDKQLKSPQGHCPLCGWHPPDRLDHFEPTATDAHRQLRQQQTIG